MNAVASSPGYVTSISRAFRAELTKTRGTLTLWMVLIAPCLVAGVLVLQLLAMTPRGPGDGNAWGNHAAQPQPRYEPAPQRQQAPAPQESGGLLGGLGDILMGSTGPRGGKREGVLESAAKSAARGVAGTMGREIGKQILRGVLGSILGGRR